jgi:hypothetical protein
MELSIPYGFRVLGHRAAKRRPVDWPAAFRGYAGCDPRAEPDREAYLSHSTFGRDFVDHLAREGSGWRFLAWQYAPVSELHGGRPRGVRYAISRATAARQDWSALKTWPRKTQSVTSGVKIRSLQEASIPAIASARLADERTSAKGSPPSWRNSRRRASTC